MTMIEHAAAKGGIRYDSAGTMVETPESCHGQYRMIGKRLQTLRKVNGFTLPGAAIRCGVGLQELKAIEAGVKPVGGKLLTKMCSVYGVRPEKVIKGR